MSERKSIININLEAFGAVAMMALVAVGAGVFFLVRGLMNESPAAFAIGGGLATLALFLLGTVWLLTVQAIGRKHERNREQAAQENFVLNAKENLAIMQATARAQGVQNATLLKQQTAQQRLLPAAGGESLDIEAYIGLNDSVLNDLDG